MTTAPNQVTVLLRKWSEGDATALEQLNVVAVDEALQRLEAIDTRQSQIVELRF